MSDEKNSAIIHKFLPQRFALKVLKEKRLKVSTWGKMNDFFDCYPVIPDVGCERIKKQNALYGILCFSEEEGIHNTLLWGHYAESASGLALGFSLGELAKCTNAAGCSVRYQDCKGQSHRQRIEWREELIQNRNYIKNEILAKTYGYKSRDWSYEKEFRIIVELNGLIAHKEMHFVPFPPEALREVIVGIRAKYNSNPSCLKRYLRQKFPGQNIAIKFLKEHESEYRFVIDEDRTIQTFPELEAK